MTNEDILSNIDLDNGYQLITKNRRDIIEEMCFENEDEKLLCTSIIDNLEKSIVEAVKEHKIAQIPYVGSLRINPAYEKFKAYKPMLHNIRQALGKDGYITYIKELKHNLNKEVEVNDRRNWYKKRTYFNNKDKYEYLCKNIGVSYANMYIFSLGLFKEIPYDKEWEDKYRELESDVK